jgi:Skp family chaperone for outer membrane proteins
MLNQANMKIIQSLTETVNTSTRAVAQDKDLNLVINEDSCFFFAPTYDITADVISEMDKEFEVAEAPAVDDEADAA